jgi:hypothetical protein
MTWNQIFLATAAWVILTAITYHLAGWQKIRECYRKWFQKKYWVDYNIVEFVSWLCKAIIIIPGLIFGIQIWQLYFLTAITSLTLIWASNKKLLPTLVAFNTLWVWISTMVLVQKLFP